MPPGILRTRLRRVNGVWQLLRICSRCREFHNHVSLEVWVSDFARRSQCLVLTWGCGKSPLVDGWFKNVGGMKARVPQRGATVCRSRGALQVFHPQNLLFPTWLPGTARTLHPRRFARQVGRSLDSRPPSELHRRSHQSHHSQILFSPRQPALDSR